MRPSENSTKNRNNITDDELLNLSVKELNRILKTLTPDERSKLKRRRRILKNRGYAYNCRSKRMSQKEILQMEKEELERDVRNIAHENEMLKVKLDSIKDRYKDLQNYAKILKANKSKK
jgi:transcription factor MAFF/G/K